MTEFNLQPEVSKLLTATEQQLGQKIKIQPAARLNSSWLRHDQGEHFLRNGQMVISVGNLAAADFIISHELLHLQLLKSSVPQLQFNLTTGDLKLDERLMAAGLELYDTLLHFTVYQQQRQLGLITEKIEEDFYRGILATLKPEKPINDQWMVLRLLSLLDGLVFFQGQNQVVQKLTELYPRSMTGARQLFDLITKKCLTGSLALRRGIVKALSGFEQQLKAWQLPAMQLQQFLTITPVFSQRQTRLQVRQLFAIYHADWQENLQFTRAYIGYYQADQQNSFVLPTPQNDQPEAYFKKIYQQSVAEFMQENGFIYQLR
ncbi:IpaB/EvcA family protein [Liquorilactobacillus sicerae]|uniref:IpaB/EvcA family protein n=1 Tax=Liquorilactobacillus sicerae TaxID=1416943 RepID=UPI0024815E85|nr:IpaB/EvcA family protein [Liquorilactobacillus sicerae]